MKLTMYYTQKYINVSIIFCPSEVSENDYDRSKMHANFLTQIFTPATLMACYINGNQANRKVGMKHFTLYRYNGV